MNLRRWTLCLLRGHRWHKLPYGEHDDSGFFVRCSTCAHEQEPADPSVRPVGW